MKIVATELEGVMVLDLDRTHDERGWFARSFDAALLAGHGLETSFVQHGISQNGRAGTLRGMHYQAPPGAEAKIVRCTAGAIHDVALDLRPFSPTFRRSVGVELSRANGRALYIPRGCAHGFLTLTDDAEVLYLISAPYDASLGRGVRWNDPAFAIEWPSTPTVIAPRDASYPDFAIHSGDVT